jgi:uncharacterized protein YabE (DUF348 family)
MANPANSLAYRLPDGRMAVDVTEAKTLTVDDCGYVQNVIYANGVVTLPATATLGTWTIRNGGLPVNASGPAGATMNGNKISVSPNASDKIQGGVSGTATDDKDLINTAATARVGDEVTIVNLAQTDGPLVHRISGIWARE